MMTPSLESGGTSTGSPEPEVVFGPSRGWVQLDVGELWAHRELLLFLAWRDIKVRYKQTSIGIAWSVLKPAASMTIFTFLFGTLLRVPSDGVPYPVFVYTALLPWLFFTAAFTQAGMSLSANAGLITKVYFPRLILPLASVLGATLDFAVGFLVLIGMLVYYGLFPGISILAVIPALLQAAVAALGVGVWIAALEVRYRDVGHAVPFMTQLWLFATPIAYPSSLIPPEWRLLYSLNPMVSVIEAFRWAILGIPADVGGLVSLSTAVSMVLLVSGVFVFRFAERTFADVA
jgi:lipopolysaccharide transport system permease protein